MRRSFFDVVTADRIAGLPPQAVRDTKRLLNQTVKDAVDAVLTSALADETARMLVEGLVIRESLLEICQEIERAMVTFEARLKALETMGGLHGRSRA